MMVLHETKIFVQDKALQQTVIRQTRIGGTDGKGILSLLRSDRVADGCACARRSMYALLMLLPQSEAFKTLHARLHSVPTVTLLKMDSQPPSSSSAPAAGGAQPSPSSCWDSDFAAGPDSRRGCGAPQIADALSPFYERCTAMLELVLSCIPLL